MHVYMTYKLRPLPSYGRNVIYEYYGPVCKEVSFVWVTLLHVKAYETCRLLWSQINHLMYVTVLNYLHL